MTHFVQDRTRSEHLSWFHALSVPRAPVAYRGTLRFANRDALDATLALAQALLDEEQITFVGFAIEHDRLVVDLEIPACAEHRFVASAVFDLLAGGATDGLVTATIDDRIVDEFFGGLD